MRVRQGNILTKDLSRQEAVKLFFSTLGVLTDSLGEDRAWFDKPSLRVVISNKTAPIVRREIQKYLIEGKLS